MLIIREIFEDETIKEMARLLGNNLVADIENMLQKKNNIIFNHSGGYAKILTPCYPPPTLGEKMRKGIKVNEYAVSTLSKKRLRRGIRLLIKNIINHSDENIIRIPTKGSIKENIIFPQSVGLHKEQTAYIRICFKPKEK